jgi:hypothetical protein
VLNDEATVKIYMVNSTQQLRCVKQYKTVINSIVTVLEFLF